MLRIFITNLKKYNKGSLVGEWVELPVTAEALDAVFERIGINEENEEYFITDYESDIEDLKVEEFENIDDLNEMAESIENMDDDEREICSALLKEGYSLEEAIDKIDDCIIYADCYTMEEVAEQYIEETGILDSIPEDLRWYFDYEKYGRDMEIEGHFVRTDSGYVQIL